MPALRFDDEQPLVDPDQLKVPESATHRRVIDLIGVAAIGALGPAHRVFRDMNWYPLDGGGPVAPDLMVLPAEAVEAEPTSYRQDQIGGPAPTVVVEVPSESDSFLSLRSKAFRYRALGTVAYLVVTGPEPAVLRLGPEDSEPRPWTGSPIEELGGLRLDVVAGELVLVTPDGLRATSDAELVAGAAARAAGAAAAGAAARVAALEHQLRSLGVEPVGPGDPGSGDG